MLLWKIHPNVYSKYLTKLLSREKIPEQIKEYDTWRDFIKNAKLQVRYILQATTKCEHYICYFIKI